MKGIVTMTLFAATLASISHADESGNMLSRSPSRFAPLKGFRVHYKSFGEGKSAVLFIHGASCDMTSWRFQVPAFAAKARVIVVDLPGHGQSDKPKVPYTMGLFAQAIDAVLKAAGVEKAVLVGHSLGTPVAREFWRLFPEKTVALVAVDGMIAPLRFPGGDERMKAQIQAMEAPGYKEVMLRFVDMTFGNLPDDLRQSMKAVIASTPQHVVVGTAQAMADPAVWKEDPITVPVQMILSAAPIWPADYEKQVAKIAAKLEFHKLKGAAHCLTMEKPDEFNGLLGAFLTRLRFVAP